MGQALYRKYRSKSFDDVIGQEHVTQTLRNALSSGKISHAYLFTGPRGVGKTSVARILAHEVNKLSYSDDSIHLDIIEIDAASNRRIDEIRELRERVHIAPTSAKYKVYIIDEVHMLTREAFNALLKTLEEPPGHCIFILATTEAHKLPDTIISRTQRFNFKPVSGENARSKLEQIAINEKIKIDADALKLIDQHGSGSFRDSIGILDQLSSLDKNVSVEAVRQFLGLAPDEAIRSIVEYISAGDNAAVLSTLTDLKVQGASAPNIASQLGRVLRESLIKNSAGLWATTLLRQLLLVPSSPSPYDQLEISILEASSGHTPSINRAGFNEAADSAVESNGAVKSQAAKISANELDVISSKNTSSPPNFDLSLWPQVVEKVKSEAASLYTALRLASPILNGHTLILSFQFPLHQKKVSQSKNIDLVGKVIESISGNKLIIKCSLNKNATHNYPSSAETADVQRDFSKNESESSVNTIRNIFGATEVLES